MAVSLNINTDNDTLNQKQRFNIDGIAFILRTYYNSRRLTGSDPICGSWYVSLNDVDDNPILSGLKCVPNRNMFEKADPTGLFTGSVFCVDTIGDVEDNVITLENFGQGKRYQLWYFTKEEIDTFKAEEGIS